MSLVYDTLLPWLLSRSRSVSLSVFCVISQFPYFIKVVAQTEGKSDAQQQLPFKFYVTQAGQSKYNKSSFTHQI
jgi:hypothetical protein